MIVAPKEGLQANVFAWNFAPILLCHQESAPQARQSGRDDSTPPLCDPLRASLVVM